MPTARYIAHDGIQHWNSTLSISISTNITIEVMLLVLHLGYFNAVWDHFRLAGGAFLN